MVSLVHPPDFYAVLGVARSASPGTIRRAYRHQALATHPDKGGHAEAFRLVVLAFETLSSGADRANYDSITVPNVSSNQATPAKATPSERRNSKRSHDAQSKLESRSTEHREGAPAQKMKKMDLAERFDSALESLRGAISDVTDRELRAELLAQLSHKLKQRLLAFMESRTSQAFTEEARGKDDRADSSHGVTARESGAQAPLHPFHLSLQSVDSSASCSDSSSSENDVSTCPGYEASMGSHLQAAPEELLALPWLLAEEYNESNRAEADPLHSYTFQASDSLNGKGPAKADAGSHHGRQSQLGVRGIGRYQLGGKFVYRARVMVESIICSGRISHDLDSAISDHVILMQVREVLAQVFLRRGMNTNLVGIVDGVEQELSSAVSRTLAENGVGEDMGFCTFYMHVSLQCFIGKTISTPHTRSIEACLEHRQRVLEAKQGGWAALRAAILKLLEHKEPRISKKGRSSGRTEASVTTMLDAAYESYAPRRAAQHARALELQALQAAREQRKQSRARQRTLRRIARLTKRAQSAIEALEERQLHKEREADRQRKQDLMEERQRKRQMLREQQQLEAARWQWFSRSDLTMDEIMQGLPVHLRFARGD